MSVEVKNIIKYYGKQKALDSVSFMIGKGELVGFLGPNGAGKSTMMKIISGFLQANSGDVFINGTEVLIKNIGIRKNIGYLPEHNPLYTDLYIKEFLEIVAGFYHLKGKNKRINEIIGITGLYDEQHKKIGALSKGYRQRVGLAQALIHDPTVLILDEPTTGLDPNQLEEIRNLIRNISKEKTVILSSHIMQEVEAVCNRVLIINNGKIIADGNVEDLKNRNFANNQFVIAEFDGVVSEDQILEIKGVLKAQFENGKWIIEAESSNDIRPALFDFAVKNGFVLLSIHERQQSLENVFQKLTK